MLTVEPASAGARLDRWLSERLTDLSRARLQSLIRGGLVRVDGAASKAAHRLRGGERVEIEVPPPADETLTPESVPLSIVYEDPHVLVVDKPAGKVVHPGAGRSGGTLAAAILAHAPTTAGVGGPRRPGIVHRLDKDTSGLLVVAKTPQAYDDLVEQLAARTVTRRYLAVVHGRVRTNEAVVDAPIGRHPTDRVKMAIRPAGRGTRALCRLHVAGGSPRDRAYPPDSRPSGVAGAPGRRRLGIWKAPYALADPARRLCTPRDRTRVCPSGFPEDDRMRCADSGADRTPSVASSRRPIRAGLTRFLG